MTKDIQDLMFAIERVRDAFHAALFTAPDPAAAVALASPRCEVAIRPVGVSAGGHEDLRRLVGDLVLPADLAFERLSRTGDRWQVAQEDTVRFTHDRELPWLLPGVAPTHRTVAVLVVTTVGVRGSLVTGYRALWDQVSLWEQLGLVGTRAGVPAAGG